MTVDLTFVCLVLHPTCAGASTVMQIGGGGGDSVSVALLQNFSILKPLSPHGSVKTFLQYVRDFLKFRCFH